MYRYKLKFYYRETEGSEQKIEFLFIVSNEKDSTEAGTVEMLRYLSKHDFYSAKLISCWREK